MVIVEHITDCDDSFEVLARAWGDVAEEELDATCQIALDASITAWHWSVCDGKDCECSLQRISA